MSGFLKQKVFYYVECRPYLWYRSTGRRPRNSTTYVIYILSTIQPRRLLYVREKTGWVPDYRASARCIIARQVAALTL